MSHQLYKSQVETKIFSFLLTGALKVLEVDVIMIAIVIIYNELLYMVLSHLVFTVFIVIFALLKD